MKTSQCRNFGAVRSELYRWCARISENADKVVFTRCIARMRPDKVGVMQEERCAIGYDFQRAGAWTMPQPISSTSPIMMCG